MKFRLSDERTWTYEFEADSAEALVRKIAAAWDARIESVRRHPGATHPAFALAARLAEVDAWLTERMARTGATDEQQKSWTRQARYWRYTAQRELGGDADSSPLRLHVWAPGDEGLLSVWCTLAQRTPSGSWGCNPYAPRVARIVSQEAARELWAGASVMVEHARNLAALCDCVGGAVRTALHPKPTLVR